MSVKIGKWNCEKSIKIRVGRLWSGGSWDKRETKKRYPAVFIIFNGKRRSWQFLSWQRPRWTAWSAKPVLASQIDRESAGLEG